LAADYCIPAGVEQQGKEVVRKAADIAAWGKAQAESHAADEKQLW
jgi:hypothetical protein